MQKSLFHFVILRTENYELCLRRLWSFFHGKLSFLFGHLHLDEWLGRWVVVVVGMWNNFSVSTTMLNGPSYQQVSQSSVSAPARQQQHIHLFQSPIPQLNYILSERANEKHRTRLCYFYLFTTIADRHGQKSQQWWQTSIHPSQWHHPVSQSLAHSLIQPPTHSLTSPFIQSVIEFAIFPNVIYSPFRNVGEHLVSRDKEQINFLRLLAIIESHSKLTNPFSPYVLWIFIRQSQSVQIINFKCN